MEFLQDVSGLDQHRGLATGVSAGATTIAAALGGVNNSVTANDATRVYGATNPVLTGTITGL